MKFCSTLGMMMYPDEIVSLQKIVALHDFANQCEYLLSLMLRVRQGKGVDSTPAGEQYRLFLFTNTEREELTKFAKDLRGLKEEDHKEYSKKLPFHRDIFLLIDLYPRKEVETVADLLEKTSKEEPLTEEEFSTAEQFLYKLACRARNEV